MRFRRRMLGCVLALAAFGVVLVHGDEVQAQAITADDFDLPTVVGLMSSTGRGAARDMTALETLINDSANGINNIDFDSDGLVDYVGCVEIRNRSSRTVAFVLHPSSSRDGFTVQVAAVNIRHDSYGRVIRLKAVHMAGVSGVREVNVRYNHGFANHLFLSWFLGARSTYQPVRRPYRFYRPHRRISEAEAERRRAAFRRRLRQPPVAPIPAELLR